MMKGAGILGSLLILAVTIGAQVVPAVDGRFAQLPEVIFTVNGQACKRDEFIKLWQREFPSRSAATQGDSFDFQYAAVREVALNEMLLRQIFTAEEIRPTMEAVNLFRNHAAKFVQEESNDEESDEEALLALGVRMLLAKRYPELIEATPEEIERFYRENQLRYLVRPQSKFVWVSRPKADPASQSDMNAIYHKLANGGNFDQFTNAAPLTGADLALASQVAETLAVGDFSPVVSGQDNYFIIKTVERSAAQFISLEEVSPRIKFFLEMNKNTALLSQLLADERSRAKIE